MNFFGINAQNIIAFVLILSRMGGMFTFAPFFGSNQIPLQIKVFFSLLTSLLFLPTVLTYNQNLSSDPVFLGLAVCKEILVGALLGMVCLAVFEIIMFSASMLDESMGFEMSAMINPFDDNEASVIGQLYFVIGMLVLLATNVHHQMILGLFRSFSVLPLGSFTVSQSTILGLGDLLQNIFEIGFQICMPIYAILFIINIILGILSRLVPQLNVFFLSFALKIGLGFILLGIFLNLNIYLFSSVLSGMGRDMHLILETIK